jgi:hypothetical protein
LGEEEEAKPLQVRAKPFLSTVTTLVKLLGFAIGRLQNR